MPVDSVRVRNRRKFGIAATRTGRDINEKPKTGFGPLKK